MGEGDTGAPRGAAQGYVEVLLHPEIPLFESPLCIPFLASAVEPATRQSSGFPMTKLSTPSSLQNYICNKESRLTLGDTSDAFTKREQANEDYAIRRREIEKLQALKEKVAAHKKHLEQLDSEM